MNSWTDKETELLLSLFSIMPNKELAKLFHRSVSSITGKAFRYGLKKSESYLKSVKTEASKKQGSLWTREEINTLIDFFNAGKSYNEISEVIGKSSACCQKKGKSLGLNRYKKKSGYLNY